MNTCNDEDVTQEEWQRFCEQIDKPICLNFLVMPMVPEETGSLLDRNGNPVMVNYSKVDWKGLAQKLQARINGHVPKSIKIYVANDGPDLFDINEICGGHLGEQDNSFVLRAAHALDDVSMANYKGGLLSLPADNGMHLNPTLEGKRPPIAGIIIAVKFTKMLQAVDYITTVMESLLALPIALPSQPLQILFEKDELGTLASELHAWFEKEFGAVYAHRCGLVMLSATASEVNS